MRAAGETAATAFWKAASGRRRPCRLGRRPRDRVCADRADCHSARLRFSGLDPESRTWKLRMKRGRPDPHRFPRRSNLVSHPGYPDPTEQEGLEMLAILSYAARLVQRSERVAPDP